MLSWRCFSINVFMAVLLIGSPFSYLDYVNLSVFLDWQLGIIALFLK